MSEFPGSLKTWRQARRFSQLDLAIEADVSARHISFLETGRSRPSADMIMRLGAALQLPLDAQNQLLARAGFAPRFAGRDWDSADMSPIRNAIGHMLTQHAPFPGLALDRMWRVQSMNLPAQRLFASVGVREGDSLLDLMVSDVMPKLVENWPDVARHAAQRLRIESAAQGGITRLDEVAAILAQDAGTTQASLAPVVPTILSLNGMRLSMFATIAQFGTPEDIALEDMKIELYFPADEATRHAFEALSAEGG